LAKAVPPAVAAVPKAPVAAPIHAAEARIKVLVVEDNREMRAFIQAELNSQYEVIEAADGRSGFEQAAAHLPALVITDVMMPIEDGLSLCRRLKNHPPTGHIPILMLTARATKDYRYQGLSLGADVYLTKPFQTRRLHAEVRNLLDNRNRIEAIQPRAVQLTSLPVPLQGEDAAFLKQVMACIEANLSDPAFGVEALADGVGVSRTVLYDRIKALASETVAHLIRRTRLERATQLLGHGELSITEISEQVGFRSPDYFRKVFQKMYGAVPSRYLTVRDSG
jgi:DNA-binding response OmpR family regulator